MGSPIIGARRPSHVAYYVALAGVVSLLILLCCYFLYYCVKKIAEVSEQECLTQTPASARPPPLTTYPVQPVVRESATAMAKLCKQLPPSTGGKDAVFPTSSSPEARNTEAVTGANAKLERIVAPPVVNQTPAASSRTPSFINRNSLFEEVVPLKNQ